ncbi:putative RNA-binding protein 6 [Trypanosoma conorhini]|uniref:Putative RNA-binding protein 6 n=1 Tax=Trypanosoma conorhini TaxID=83891 RepID=A0A422N4Q2_9TRYP|nr:putative RNA-binding protein 6 [Trypanosoma conorhini]RNF00402.1 putative RNA-binding protein 6 [Trypanosoma conorhini]
MHYYNNQQPSPHMASYSEYQEYATTQPSQPPLQRQPYMEQQRQHQQRYQQYQVPQQRSAMPPQVSPNSNFMQVPLPSMDQNIVGGWSAGPGGYSQVGYTSTQRHQTTPVPSNDERYRKQLIVNYLAPDVATAELHDLFSRFGPLDGARIIHDKRTNLPKGYGFVYFCRPEDAKEAVERMSGFELHGKRIKVGYSTNPLNIVSGASSQSTWGNMA